MIFLTATAIVAAMGIVGHFLPGWMRPELYFAVRVDPAFRQTETGRRILLRYRLIVWAGVITTISLEFALRPEWVVVQIIAFLLALIDAHRRTLPYAVPAATVSEVDLSAPAEEFPGGPMVMFFPIVILSLLAFWADRHFDELPQRIPVHWGIHGANRWIERTHAGVAVYLAICAAASLLFAMMAWGIFHWSRRVSTRGPGSATERRFRRRNAQMLLLVSWFMAVQAWITLARPNQAFWGPVLVLSAVVGILATLIRYHQGPGDRAPDSCWKLGIIYYNPADPSLFIPKRFGIGYTFNFGNRWTWILLGGVIVPIVCVSVILK